METAKSDFPHFTCSIFVFERYSKTSNARKTIEARRGWNSTIVSAFQQNEPQKKAQTGPRKDRKKVPINHRREWTLKGAKSERNRIFEFCAHPYVQPLIFEFFAYPTKSNLKPQAGGETNQRRACSIALRARRIAARKTRI